jgi:hypothetical protein
MGRKDTVRCDVRTYTAAPVRRDTVSKPIDVERRVGKDIARADAPVKVRLHDAGLDRIQRLVPLPEHQAVPGQEQRVAVLRKNVVVGSELLVDAEPRARHAALVGQQVEGLDVVCPLLIRQLMDFAPHDRPKPLARCLCLASTFDQQDAEREQMCAGPAPHVGGGADRRELERLLANDAGQRPDEAGVRMDKLYVREMETIVGSFKGGRMSSWLLVC